MLRQGSYVGVFALLIAVVGVLTLRQRMAVGPMILVLGLVPLLGLILARRPLSRAVPDLIFGGIDTGLLTLPALGGGVAFGVAGAIAGGIIGDSITDAIAGFFEGRVAEWLRGKGIESSREPVTTALGKMAGCLLGSGLVLSVAWLAGLRLEAS